jgi:hypothetical protein
MAPEDWDPVRKIRAPDKLWREFGELAKERGLSRSVLLRDYMRRAVAEWKGRKGKPGHDAHSDDT